MSEKHIKDILDTDDIKKEFREIVSEHIIPVVDKHLKKAAQTVDEDKHDVEEDEPKCKKKKHHRKRSWFSLIIIAIIGFLVGRVSH